MVHFARDASAAFIRDLWQRMTRVDSDDPLRCALNRVLAAVLIPLIVVDLAFIVTTLLSGENVKAVLGTVSLPVHLIALWLNRRGTTYGAWLETLLLVFVSVVGVATFGPSLVEGSVPLALVFPAVAATLFIRPSAGLAVLPLEIGSLAVALAIIGVPWERALPFLSTALIALTAGVIFLVAGGSIVWSALRRYIDAIAQALHRLLELGVRIAVDDFGTSYSSHAYLKRFPVSVLKIDRSFIDGICRDTSAEAIITAVIAMAKGLAHPGRGGRCENR